MSETPKDPHPASLVCFAMVLITVVVLGGLGLFGLGAGLFVRLFRWAGGF